MAVWGEWEPGWNEAGSDRRGRDSQTTRDGVRRVETRRDGSKLEEREPGIGERGNEEGWNEAGVKEEHPGVLPPTQVPALASLALHCPPLCRDALQTGSGRGAGPGRGGAWTGLQAVDQAGLRQQVQCAIAAEEGGGKSNGSRGQEEDNLGGIGEQERRDQEEDQKGEREQPGAAEVHRKRGGGGGTGGKSYCSLREKAEGSRAWRVAGDGAAMREGRSDLYGVQLEGGGGGGQLQSAMTAGRGGGSLRRRIAMHAH
eukprot:2778785-Rhodomonas_salina.1